MFEIVASVTDKDDGAGTAGLTVTVFEANQAPISNAGEDQAVEFIAGGTLVLLDGSSSSDPDGDPITYSWVDEEGVVISTQPKVQTSLGLGTHVFTLTASDGSLTSTDQVVVVVEDTTSPTISLQLLVSELWPPNGRMHLVAEHVGATDASGSNLSVGVTSNEEIDGTGDGNTDMDWEVHENSDGTFDVYVRAERAGNGTGRVYAITAIAVDGVGNVANVTREVTVPHNG